MNSPYWFSCGIALIFSLISNNCVAISWQETLTNLSDEPSHQDAIMGTQSGGLSLSSLSTLLEDGNSVLSANTMANAAGVMEYCTKNKLSSVVNTEKIQRKLAHKLRLAHPRNSAVKKDYSQGVSGLLNTHDGQQLDMNDLSHSKLAAEVKMKACDLVFKQGMNYLSD